MFPLLFGEMFILVKRIVSEYYLATFLIGIISAVLWRICKYIKLYAEFPTFPMILHIAYYTVLRRIPKHLPFDAFLFQELVLLARRFRKEVLFLIWQPKPILIIFGEEVMKTFSNDEITLEKGSKYSILKESLGNGLLTSDVKTWRIHRRILNPVFHVGMLKKKMSIFKENANILVKKLEVMALNGSPISVIEPLLDCSFDILCEYVLGLKTAEVKEIAEMYKKNLKMGRRVLVNRMGQPWLYFKFMMNILPSGREYSKLLENIHYMNNELLSAMEKKLFFTKVDTTSEIDKLKDDDDNRKSFAHILLYNHLKDNTFTLEDMRSQVSTFIINGFDSVSHGILWSLFLLGHHPAVQDQAYEELDTLLDGDLKYEDLHNLRYLECVLKETLRLYPVTPMYLRKLNKDMKCGKYNVPKGTDITFFTYMLHRNPEIYPDPEKFNPNRFQEGTSSIDPRTYIPFAHGIRNCIGKGFAMLEMKLILALIIRNFKITSLEKKEDVEVTWNIVLTPVRPLLFRFKPRK